MNVDGEGQTQTPRKIRHSVSECMWFLVVLVSLFVSIALAIVGVWYTVVSIQGLYLSNDALMKQQTEMKFDQVALLSKYACNGQTSNQTVCIHCAAVAKSKLASLDPMEVAAGVSYDTLYQTSTTETTDTAWYFTRDRWISHQQTLMYMCQLVTGPCILLSMLSLFLLLVTCIPYCAIRRLKRVHEANKAVQSLIHNQGEQYNRSLDAVCRDVYSTTMNMVDTQPPPPQTPFLNFGIPPRSTDGTQSLSRRTPFTLTQPGVVRM